MYLLQMSVLDKCHQQMLDILMRFPYKGEEGATQLLDHVFIGGYRAADDVTALTQLGITHVLNCAAYRKSDENLYPSDSSIKHYMQFHADDAADYDILAKHFAEARRFIDNAKREGGRCLVHCAMGINRSGAICAAYIMVDRHWDLLSVMELLKKKRGRILANRGFQRELIRFAQDNGLLKLNKS